MVGAPRAPELEVPPIVSCEGGGDGGAYCVVSVMYSINLKSEASGKPVLGSNCFSLSSAKHR